MERHFRLVVSDGGADPPHLFRGQFRQEQMRETAVERRLLRFIQGALDERDRKLAPELPRELHADRLFQGTDEVGQRADAGSTDRARALDGACFHGGVALLDQSSR